ncbi:NACHT, LRR and PYD domains-containing protein 12-like [Stylophora pistillata]|uniref:NACHT, LRR and PYD domains-containing protein 12-like n=1 Tax=Stylophora pistillata TaxID=50429 RepID=UPI000C03A72D|nr:NACHT, LRR and PYD domains-containing protein 12-like [Stylophora pistillata]
MLILEELPALKLANIVNRVTLSGWFLYDAIFIGIFTDTLELNSKFRSHFRCGGADSENIDLVREQCSKLYEKEYNNYSFSIDTFVYTNLLLTEIVCAISCCVMARLIVGDNLSPSVRYSDEGKSHDQENSLRSRNNLFIAYCCQLFTRWVLRVFFMVMQTNFLYLDLPSFSCHLTFGAYQPRYSCYGEGVTAKNIKMKVILVVNGIFALGILMEAVYISLRVWKDDSFIENSEFFKDYLYLSSPKRRLRKFIKNAKKTIKEDTCRPPQLRSPFSSIPGEGQPVYAISGERNATLRGLEDILNHENKKVLIVGRPGIGKTLCCTKVLRDWAFNRIFHGSSDAKIHFDAAFFVKFRASNTAADLSLKEMLMLSEHSPSKRIDDEVWNYILENPERVLFIFDGIDEFKHNSKIGKENEDPQFKSHVDEKMPLFALYEKLATGKVLKGAAVLTTTRPSALPSIESLPFDKVFEIRGYSSEQVKDYVTTFAGKDTRAGARLWRHIGGNISILSLCYIPGSCFIICSTLFQMLSFDSLPMKLTDIYKKAVKIFYLRHDKEFHGKNFTCDDLESDDLPRECEKKFERLEKMAFEGIKERRLSFGRNEVGGMEDTDLFYRLPDRRTDGLKREEQFCFIHLTMHEFFAARHLANMGETELKKFVSENIEDGKWQLTLQFLAGLVNDKEKLPSKIITDLFPVKTAEETESVFYNEEWPRNREPRKVTGWPTEDRKRLVVTLLKCCSENSEITETVQRKLQQISFNCVNFLFCQLTSADCASLVTVINVLKISHLDLFTNNIGPVGCFEICKLLECRESQLSWLNLTGNQSQDEGAKYLAKAIRNSNCQLRTLHLSFNNIGDKGAQHLAEAINNENCQLSTLYLAGNDITEAVKQRVNSLLIESKCILNI